MGLIIYLKRSRTQSDQRSSPQSSVYVSEHVSKHAPDISPMDFLRTFPARKSQTINNINGPFKRDDATSIIEEESEWSLGDTWPPAIIPHAGDSLAHGRPEISPISEGAKSHRNEMGVEKQKRSKLGIY